MSGEGKKVINLDEFKTLLDGGPVEEHILARLSQKTAEVVVGLHQVVSNLDSRVTTTIAKLEVLDHILDRVDSPLTEVRLHKLESDVGEIKSLLRQVANHIGMTVEPVEEAVLDK